MQDQDMCSYEFGRFRLTQNPTTEFIMLFCDGQRIEPKGRETTLWVLKYLLDHRQIRAASLVGFPDTPRGESSPIILKDYIRNLRDALDPSEREAYVHTVGRQGYEWVYPIDRMITVHEFLRTERLIRQIDIPGANQFILEHPEFCEGIPDKLIRYDKFCSLPDAKDKEFCVAVALITLSRSADGMILAKVDIPHNPYVAYDGSQRGVVECFRGKKGEDPCHPLQPELERFLSGEIDEVKPFLGRATAGGAITTLKVPKEAAYSLNKPLSEYAEADFERFVIVGQKDSKAMPDPYKLVPQSGISECMRTDLDWYNPRRLVVGECAEEIRIIDASKKQWYSPHFDDAAMEDMATLQARVEETLLYRLKCWHQYDTDTITAMKVAGRPCELEASRSYATARIFDIGSDTLDLTYGNGGDIYRGVIAVDPGLGVVDFMAAVEITVMRPFKELLLCDGEAHKMELLWRHTLAFEPAEFLKLMNDEESNAFFFGDTIREDIPDESLWVHHAPATLTANPKMAIPLAVASPAFIRAFRNELGLGDVDVKPFDISRYKDRSNVQIKLMSNGRPR